MGMLDKSKPYGGIVGFFHGARYEQNGRFYDADGIEIVIDDEPEEPDMTASMRGFSESALSSVAHSNSLYGSDPIMTKYGESPHDSGGMDGATPIGDFVIDAQTIGGYGDAG
jgi:hypothetical protein